MMEETGTEGKLTSQWFIIARVIVGFFLLLLVWFLVQQDFIIQFISLVFFFQETFYFLVNNTLRYYTSDDDIRESDKMLNNSVTRFISKSSKMTALFLIITIIVISPLTYVVVSYSLSIVDPNILHYVVLIFWAPSLLRLFRHILYLAYHIIKPKES
jgi:ABC-type spermidine/putrescine transport system permease subunit I